MSEKIYTSAVRRQVDADTIQSEGITSLDLMERAGQRCALWIKSRFSRSHPIYIFCGKGNNGGDGWVIARHLALDDYRVTVFHLFPIESFSQDALVNFRRAQQLTNISVSYIADTEQLPLFDAHDVIVDAILGSGLNQPVKEPISGIIHYLNQSEAIRIAIDIPSGLPGEGIVSDDCVVFAAHYTLTFQFPFLSFLFSEHYPYVGQWFLLDIGLQPLRATPFMYVNEKDIIFRNRSPFTYKNEWGHALLLAGSKGMIGAAVLAASACFRSGCGLVTVHVPGHGAQVIHATVPEAIVSYDAHDNILTELPLLSKYSAIGIGPGMGTADASHQIVKKILENAPCPLVIDADALNILARYPEWYALLPAQTILTPHPGEFDRLFGKSANSWERFEKQLQVAQKYQIIVILKGHYTSIALPDGKCYFNSTGNPGMATAGSGDVLTGIILSLLAQHYTATQAALYAVYLHGLAGDIAAQKLGQNALIASDIVNHIGSAFEHIRKTSANY